MRELFNEQFITDLMKYKNIDRMIKSSITAILIGLSFLGGQNFKLHTYQIALSERPMNSDSLFLKGAIGTSFYQTGSGDTLLLKGGLWNIASEFYLKPPSIIPILADTIFDDGMPVIARAIATDINGVASTDLYIQLGGSADAIKIPMEALNDTIFEVSVPDSLVTIFNLRAHVESVDSMANTAESDYETPAVEFAAYELSMEEPYSHYPEGILSDKWRMMAWPGELADNYISPSDLDSGHVFYDWNPNTNEWIKPDAIEPGRAYWFKHHYSEPVVVSNKKTTGLAIPLVDYTIQLRSGWNMIGSPFSFPVLAEYDPETISGLYLYGEEDRDGWEGPSQVLDPWAGYAIFNDSQTIKSIMLKPFTDSLETARMVFTGWELQLDIDGEKYFDHTGRIGRIEYATEGEDGYDAPKLPLLSEYLSLAMDIGNKGTFEHSTDFRSLDESNGVWNLRLYGKGEPGPVIVTGSILNQVPEDLYISVVDIPRRAVLDHFLETGLTIQEKITNAYELKLVAGDENYVLETVESILADIPEEFSLSQNYPNPFNPLTKIDFALPKTGRVVITIYNILGQEVTTIINQRLDYGYHTVTWQGTDRMGRPVGSGVYFSELKAAGFRKTRKMLLMK